MNSGGASAGLRACRSRSPGHISAHYCLSLLDVACDFAVTRPAICHVYVLSMLHAACCGRIISVDCVVLCCVRFLVSYSCICMLVLVDGRV